ncbi:MAG: tRNA (adenosine(37)-N6)-threonylcarbamoyltransferase complex dimerization subunit type 1 TsaB [Bacilli bacterium]|nr:tRNA (adenosine(37)-N6)-threonylcarbamoyltransferase complex dimerization subunit type 1 TsaB [Bacilli bacterium]
MILFISTYSEKVIIGILNNNKLILKKEVTSHKSHSLTLVPTIEEVIKEVSITLNDLKEIIVVNGPGSFTGVRLGVTVAKTLAYTLNISIKTITSIEAISLSNNNPKKIVIVPDNKGKYIGVFKDNKLVDKIIYLSNTEYDEYIKDYPDYQMAKEYLDIEKITIYLKNINNINPHSVNPIYIKTIEVLNGK